MKFCSLVVVAVALLAGCSTVEEESSTGVGQFTEPAWFAEQAQEREAYRTQLQACYTSLGWNVTVDLDGGVVESFEKSEFDRFMIDKKSCHEEMGLSSYLDPVALTADDFGYMYVKDLDTYNCLVNEGYDMAPPPSKDVYIEQGLTIASGESAELGWLPYFDPAVISLSQAENAALKLVCPERWL